jgi:hypothetical protein
MKDLNEDIYSLLKSNLNKIKIKSQILESRKKIELKVYILNTVKFIYELNKNLSFTIIESNLLRMKKNRTLLMILILVFLTYNFSFSQSIEKLDKKELRIELIAKQQKIDSLNNVIYNLNILIGNARKSYDSIVASNTEVKRFYNETKSENIKIQTENLKIQTENLYLQQSNDELLKKTSLLKDSIIHLKSQINNYDSLRFMLVNKYLRNKKFKLKYYNSHDGTCAEGGSFTTIAELNGKYYIGDITCGKKEVIKLAENNQQSSFNLWNFVVDDNLEFIYTKFNEQHKGEISTKSIEWQDYFSDSSYMSSVIVNEDQLKVPLGFIESETIRGPFPFMIYFLIGKRSYLFNGQNIVIYNPIILESNKVTIILTDY